MKSKFTSTNTRFFSPQIKPKQKHPRIVFTTAKNSISEVRDNVYRSPQLKVISLSCTGILYNNFHIFQMSRLLTTYRIK